MILLVLFNYTFAYLKPSVYIMLYVPIIINDFCFYGTTINTYVRIDVITLQIMFVVFIC